MKLLILLACIFGLAYSQECRPDQFTCNNGNCIPASYLCDGDDDCRDGSDEVGPPPGLNVTQCPPCDANEFQCDNGRCIYGSWICDGDNDCRDGSDERDENGNCPECPSGMFKCPGTGRCVAPADTCDGYNDCGDWEDEREEACPCADDEIRCSKESEDGPPGACIPPEWVCDEEGIWDCPSGEDEQNCTVRSVGTRHSQPHRVRPVHLKGKKGGSKKAKTVTMKHLWYKTKKNAGKGKH